MTNLRKAIDTMPQQLCKGTMYDGNLYCAVGWMLHNVDYEVKNFRWIPVYDAMNTFYGLHYTQVNKLIDLNDTCDREAVIKYLNELEVDQH